MRYLFSKANKDWTKLSFSCASKHLTKCVAKCKMEVVFDSTAGEMRVELVRWSKVEEHNHETSRADIVVMDMNTKMDEMALVRVIYK